MWLAWFTWVDVTPALRFLNEVQVWKTTVAVNVVAAGPDGKEEVKTKDQTVAITLANVLAALLAAALLESDSTMVVARRGWGFCPCQTTTASNPCAAAATRTLKVAAPTAMAPAHPGSGAG